MPLIRSSFVALAALAFIAPIHADYDTGIAAFQRGDLETAEREFLARAEQGEPRAQYSLGMLYLKRKPPDYERARPWLEKSAAQDIREAQYMIGLISFYGVGVTKDQERGLNWLRRAREQGHRAASELLDEIRESEARNTEVHRREIVEAQNLRSELNKARASQRNLQKQLTQAEQRAELLQQERDSLNRARITHARATEELRRDRMKLETRLAELQATLAAKPPVHELTTIIPRESSAEEIVTGTILDILPGGILLTDVSRQIGGKQQSLPNDSVVFVHVIATNGLSDGQRVEFIAHPAQPYRYRSGNGSTDRVPAYRAIGERSTL